MKLSKIIAKLQEAKEKYGDLECIKTVEHYSEFGYSCFDEEASIEYYKSSTFYKGIDDLENGEFLKLYI